MTDPIYRVVILGSSGGGSAMAGRQDTYGLVCAIYRELKRAGIGLAAVQMVDCDAPLDSASPASRAVLWVLDPQSGQLQLAAEGSLRSINEKARSYDRHIGRMIEDRRIQGIISVSSDPIAVNHCAFTAASKAGVPVVGRGGTSLSEAATLNALILGTSGGSVATTPAATSMACVSTLAGHFGVPYPPPPIHLSLPSIVGTSVPAFVAVAIFMHLARALQGRWPGLLVPVLGEQADGLDLASCLPVVMATVTASQVANMGEGGALAGVVAGTLLGPGSVIAATLVGALAGALASRLLVALSRTTRVPATACSIIVGGVVGVVAGLVGRMALLQPALWLRDRLMLPLLRLLKSPPAAAALGAAACWGSQRGLYHSLHLPAILLEMEHGEPSYLGAVDELSLVLVCAGICVAQLLVPRRSTRGLSELARRGAVINLLFGDLVEACYPFMEQDTWVAASAYVASMWSTVLLARADGRSSAYLPLPLSIWLSDGAIARPALVAFGLPFLVAALRNATAEWRI